jgi:hypothetical protein
MRGNTNTYQKVDPLISLVHLTARRCQRRAYRADNRLRKGQNELHNGIIPRVSHPV